MFKSATLSLIISACIFIPSTTIAAPEKPICFLKSTPPVDIKYKPVRKVKAGKGTYGANDQALPALAKRARKLGADAVINYQSGQRFGFWPWRVVRPVAWGLAVKWENPQTVNCAALGGVEY